MGVSKSNTIQSTNQAGCLVSPPHMYHPRRPAHQQQQTFKVWQPQRAARSKRPNTPSDGSKHNGFQTTNQAVLIPKHVFFFVLFVSRQDRAHDQEHHPPTKANTQTCSYLDFNQFLIRRITRNICLRLRIKQIQILTCREQDIR